MAKLTLQQAFEQAQRHQQSGQIREADNLYRQILRIDPAHAGAMHYLGLAAHQQQNNDLAIDLIGKAIALNPRVAEAHNSLGVALLANGRVDQAIAAFEKAITLKSNLASAHYNLGNALNQAGKLDEAIAAYRTAITSNPKLRKAYLCLGDALMKQRQFAAAISAYRDAVSLDPSDAHAHSQLGDAMRNSERLDEAIAAYQNAVALNADLPEAYCNLGNCFRRMGEPDKAIDSYQQAIRARPDYAQAHYNLGLLLLARGDFSAGWAEYEWRWKCEDFAAARRNFQQPQWEGQTLNRRTILLHAEQGFGDAIQFIRYVPLVIERGGTVIVECRAELVRLFDMMAEQTPGGFQIVPRGQPLPPFDVHAPLLSLPRLFATTAATVPNALPYLHADPRDAAKWRDLLAGYAELKVALVWSGHPGHKNDKQRSMSTELLMPLTRLPGIKFFSLQKRAATEDKAIVSQLNLVDWTEQLHDFADTAALIAHLDLVIAVDTAVVHLAGAMGKPVWTLLPFVPDWRWLAERTDSPWYPSMRLFRQPAKADWASVIDRVAQALVLEAANRRPPG
jgi:tetratricopeptide (TPR) repeat protein